MPEPYWWRSVRLPTGLGSAAAAEVVSYGQLAAESAAKLDQVGIPKSRLEAEVLVAHAAGLIRTALLARLREEAPSDIVSRVDALLARRVEREPLAYIVGRREFYGRDFVVNPHVLIPRSETELLVSTALDLLGDVANPVIFDVGTGSGAIGLSILAETTDSHLVATDISRDALRVASLNAGGVGVADRVDFVICDLLNGVARPAGSSVLLTANLPYVPAGRAPSLEPEVARFEPAIALFSGEDGLQVIRGLISSLDGFLLSGEYALLELDESHGEEGLRMARELLPGFESAIKQDSSGHDRMLQLLKRVGI